MINLNISFENEWYLLLLIPAILFTIVPYFRLPKRYRCTRNRLSSMTLHLIIMLLSILVLSGIVFSYEKKNYDNEVILLVDVSDSNADSELIKNRFVKEVIDEADDIFKLGIVTFGYDQVYASPLSHDKEHSYNQYLNSKAPNKSATNIEGALNYAKGLFTHPNSGKIILISDGIETDGDASSVISSIAMDGIIVDTVFYSNSDVMDEVQLINATMPEENVIVGANCKLGLTLESSISGDATITIYDNDVASAPIDITLKQGVKDLELNYKFDLPGLHKLSFEITSGNDTLMKNNRYYSYINLAVYDKILIVENNGEGEYLKNLLSDVYEDIELVSISQVAEKKFDSVDNLRAFDQVIMLNISDNDIQTQAVGFDKALNEYVKVHGGGLLTAGGEVTDSENAHAYNREDLFGTILQEMLPVQAINYTPPLGVVIVIDRSGSMSGEDKTTGKTYLDLAKEGALSTVDALTERDYCGIITLESEYSMDLNLISATQKYKIQEVVASIEDATGGTIFAGALDRAEQALMANQNIEKRHIILVSDGQPGDPQEEILEQVELVAAKGITISTFCIGSTIPDIMDQIAEKSNGRSYCLKNPSDLAMGMREDVKVDEIKKVDKEPFQPTFGSTSPVLEGVREEDLPELEGFYGVKAKASAVTSLKGPFVPLYSSWDYGKGKVGSFMCDLSGYWSDEFLNDENGRRVLDNIIGSLFPNTDIRPNDIKVTITQENYSNTASIFTPLGEEESIRLTITSPASEVGLGDETNVIEGNASSGFSRISYQITTPGVHNILVEKLGADGSVIGTYSTEQTFSYSQEYNPFLNDAVANEESLAAISESGKGEMIDDAKDVFKQLITSFTEDFDPRILFMIIAVLLFLLDVAVRKFKFKWPHEMIKDYRDRKVELKK